VKRATIRHFVREFFQSLKYSDICEYQPDLVALSAL